MEDIQTQSSICFFVNCKKIHLDNPDPEISLLYYLRRTLRLTGTKQGCNEGGCGACTVMISKYDPVKDKIKHFSVTACLISICSLDGVAVTTIEGIGSTKTKIHPCQRSIAQCHGTQCGYCTPGMVMSMYTLLRNNPQPTEQEMEASLRGNLCRCTGYRSILESFKPFCGDCNCRIMQKEHSGSNTSEDASTSSASNNLCIDATQEPIFPPELKAYSRSKFSVPICLQGSRVQWYQPVSLEQLLLLREAFPWDESNRNRIVAGNMDLQHCRVSIDHPNVLISVDRVLELTEITSNNAGLVIGAAVTISDLETELLHCIGRSSDEVKTRGFRVFLEMLSVFGSQQIKNKVTIGGVVVSNNSWSDITPILVALQSKATVASTVCRREVTISESRHLMEPNEVLLSVCLPYLEENEYISFYKQSRRKYLDTSIVNACMWIKMEGVVVRDIRLVFGNMGDTVKVAHQTANAIVNNKWNNDTLDIAVKTLAEDMELPRNIKGGMAQYRRSLCLSFFYKFFLYIQTQLPKDTSSVTASDISAITPLPCGPSKGSRVFQSVPSSQPLWDCVGRPIMRLTAIEQATGEAKYVDDIPATEGESFAAFVLSDCAHGTFTIDTSALEEMKGIRGFISAKDVPGTNNNIGLCNDDHIFADGEVTAVGQIIGIVVGDDRIIAQRGAKLVKVTYKELPAIFTIEEAVSNQQFFELKRELKCGDVTIALSKAEQVLKGEMRIGGQEQFYMETCSCLCIPKGEKGEMEIIASTHDLNALQNYVSIALNVPSNRIVAKVKRLGGSFGGKQLSSDLSYTAVAVAAHVLQTPVRCVFERNQDMMNIGGRSPFKGNYKVAFDSNGIIEALDVDLYSNAGYSGDLTLAVIDFAVLNLQSVYNIPNMSIRSQACKTNLPSFTSMRGFGAPQGAMITENAISHVADTLGIERDVVQEANLLKNGDKLIHGEEMNNCTIRRCWSTLKEQCQFEKKKTAVKEFNSSSRWKKQGIALVPIKVGMGFQAIMMNQAGALLHVYTDGSVLLTHGGVDMGQGLHTKMIQVCSKCLSIPMDKIHLNDTSSEKVPNATVTGGSISSDLYGMAVKHACDQINERLRPFKEADPEAGWDSWVLQAYLSRVNLSAQGFYKTPDIWMDWENGVGRPFAYYSYGVGCSVVEVDVLTGSFQVVSTDLIVDAGKSLNPIIDAGQIEGAFMQGLGFFTMEEYVFLKDGRMYSVGPKQYKIPGCSDVPIEMNVTLLDKSLDSKGILSAKGVGEPPLFLAASVFFAIKEAVKNARIERGLKGSFDFWSPATAERIRMACEDQFVNKVEQEVADINWNLSL